MATARHPKATFFVQRQLFSGLTSFAEFESKIAALPDEQSRGAAFEVFAEAYLATQRKYDAAQVWPHGSVPLDILKNLGLTVQDKGVDGMLQTLLGQFNAYQVKFRTGRPSLTWRELSTFFGLTDSLRIHNRVVFTNCDEFPDDLQDRRGFFCIRGADLDRLEADDFRAMEAWLADAAFIAPKKSPDKDHKHQAEALDALPVQRAMHLQRAIRQYPGAGQMAGKSITWRLGVSPTLQTQCWQIAKRLCRAIKFNRL
jgi:predicted helicase